MSTTFSGKNIIVTGGASGIGAALVKKLHEQGAIVAAIDRAATYTGPGNYFCANMADSHEAEEAFVKIIRAQGDIDYVINNAGIFMGGEIRSTPIDKWHTVIDNNIYSISHGTHLAYQHMIAKGSGHIINVASTAGLIPVPIMGIYGATKYALVGLSHTLRNEGVDLGVKVSVACPTIVDTPLYDTAIYNDIDKRRLLRLSKNLQSPEVAADRILLGIRKNRATIHTSAVTRAIWLVYRVAPGVYDMIARRMLRTYRSKA